MHQPSKPHPSVGDADGDPIVGSTSDKVINSGVVSRVRCYSSEVYILHMFTHM